MICIASGPTTAIPKYATDTAADAPFGALHGAYAHKWTGSGCFHPPHGKADAKKALRWAVSSTYERAPTFNIGVLVCPPGTQLGLMQHHQVQVLLHLNYRQHPPLTQPSWYMNKRMQHKMPRTWELFIIAVSNDAGLSKYADSHALDAALLRSAARDLYNWPPETMKALRPHNMVGPPLDASKAFQRAIQPLEPAPLARETRSYEVPEHVVVHAPTRRFVDKTMHWYTDGRKSKERQWGRGPHSGSGEAHRGL
jgi:hypothetical protein